ncbi:MAG: peptide-methionine (S)-S-oxide reductase MsrA [Bacteroidales bacterium]
MRLVKLIISILIMVFISHEIYSQNHTKMELATFGSGCFWCTEAIFDKVKGVESAVSGYSGGKVKNPTYKEVCTGNTGHAEVIQVTFNPDIISYDELLEIFWKTHDPTTLNRQGADVGTQYRSVIFYHNDKQKELAETYKKKLDEAKVFTKPIVTEITPFEIFYKAENDHQEYYENNKAQPYCNFVITPKIEKVKEVFKDKLK